MKYFQQYTLAHVDKEFCFIDDSTKGIVDYEIGVGEFMDKYPSDPGKVSVKLAEDMPGLILPSFIGNTGRLLIVHKDVSEEVLKFNPGEIQVLPLTVLNHKNRIHSRDYVFLNPLHRIECVNIKLSKVLRHPRKAKILKIKKIVLDRNKLDEASDLFRPLESHSRYIYSERLVDAINARGFTNFEFRELEQG